ncbi:hypothetical protein [Salinisphaera hydrothermalis]|uniref:hypothetical protein n=1 Tax=Salinisphaera hydrothermalis TaxID=563188 RepID=UPI003341BADA
MRVAISIFAIVAVGLLIGGALRGVAYATGLLPTHTTPIIRIVHTNTGCQL